MTDDPAPTVISAREMVAKFTAARIHPDSPAGRGLLRGGTHGVFEDPDGALFTVDPDGEPESAQGSPQPAYTGPVAVAPDLGDLVADRIEALMGITHRVEREHTADRHVSQALAPRRTAGARDLGDEVADRIEIQMFGSIRGAK